MRLDKLTTKSQEALADADILARKNNHQEVTSLHMLAALIDQGDGTVRPVLEREHARDAPDALGETREVVVDPDLFEVPEGWGRSWIPPF